MKVHIKRENELPDDPDDHPLRVAAAAPTKKRKRSTPRLVHICHEKKSSDLQTFRLLLDDIVFDDHVREIDVRAADWIKDPVIVRSMRIIEDKVLAQYYAFIDKCQDKDKNTDPRDLYIQDKIKSGLCLANPRRWQYMSKPTKTIFIMSPYHRKRIGVLQDGTIKMVKPITIEEKWRHHGKHDSCEHLPSEQYVPVDEGFASVGMVKVSDLTRFVWPIPLHCPRLFPIACMNKINSQLIETMHKIEADVLDMLPHNLDFHKITSNHSESLDLKHVRGHNLLECLTKSIRHRLTQPNHLYQPTEFSPCLMYQDNSMCYRNPYMWMHQAEENTLALISVCNQESVSIDLETMIVSYSDGWLNVPSDPVLRMKHGPGCDHDYNQASHCELLDSGNPAMLLLPEYRLRFWSDVYDHKTLLGLE